ncbi:MAG TPA: sigma factor [Acetivibrio sp.]|uniref:RNA polymerase sigma factor n=1 Tax=Acetivibrio sp. TaxID=1872092 RepID=UPI002C77A9C0|nr:sigma factor [Acetivibrio sp.]HOM03416.1 sigma factor [Acetivibrio sp.]
MSNEVVKFLENSSKNNFKDIYNTFKRKVYSKAMILLKNEAQAEDVVQEVFIKVFYKLNTLRNPEKFEP